ncbi:MAG TPA: type VI secretion protein IcmF/TssM N-terminal domain-containing protein [Thermoanaerobaculia bacterium]
MVLAIIVLLAILVRKRRVKAAAEEPDGEPATAEPEVVTVDFTRPGQALQLSSSFHRALRTLRRHLRASDYAYRLPWYLLVGETASGKSAMLDRAGFSLPLGAPDDASPEEGSGCNWWLFDQGVVLDVAGDFLLGADGRSSNQRGWRQILKLLRRHRPERPIDGFVLAIPCADLLSPDAGLASQKAGLICQKLREAQRQLGMALPVYVMVTGCERVSGFGGLFMEVDDKAHGEIAGWSSPYSLESPFRPEWVDEAFEAVEAGLRKVQLRIYGERLQLDEPDGIFLFPLEVQALREPLRAFLAQVFRPSTFAEPLFLRGIYLSGELAAGAAGAGQPAKALFVRDVFERKVFPERGVARPSTGALTGRNRLIFAARAALVALALAASLGVWWAHGQLAHRKEVLFPVLQGTASSVRETRERIAAGEDLREEYLEEKALQFLQGMASIDASRYGSVFLPSSWVSPFNRNLRSFIVAAYDDVVFQALGMELEHRAESLVRAQRPVTFTEDAAMPVPLAEGGFAAAAPAEEELGLAEEPLAEDLSLADEFALAPPEILAVGDTPELAALRDYVNRLVELERHARSYNDLKSSHNLRDLAALVTYLFGASVPEAFFESSRLYQQALERVHYEPFDPKQYQGEAVLTARLLAHDLYGRLYRDNPALIQLRLLGEEMNQIGTRTDGRDVNRSALLRRLSGMVAESQRLLARPEIAWVSRPDLALGEPFDKLLGSVRSSAFLGREVEEEIRQLGNEEALRLHGSIAGLSTVYTGALVQQEGPGKPWKISPRVTVVETALNDLLNESFMHLESRSSLRTSIARGTQLFWDTRLLLEAAALYKPYEEFLANGLLKFPSSLRGSLHTAARKRLSAKMKERIAQAQDLRAAPDAGDAFLERNIQAQVENLQAAGQPLADLVSIFDRIEDLEDRDLLSGLTAAQAYDLLRSVDRLLQAETPYVPKGGTFEWWSGEKAVSLAAYEAGDPEELLAYLDAQRNRLAQIADQYADPVLRVLGGKARQRDPGMRALVNKWEGILAELRKYEGKKPGNSVSALEAWIAADLAAVDANNCARALAPRRLDQTPADFFLQTRSALRRQLYLRCQELTEGQALAAYEKIAASFNQRLAGRFPFAEGVPGRLDREADPEEIRRFFRVFDANAAAIRDLAPGDPRFGDDEEEIRAFIDQLAKVRALFAPYLDAPRKVEQPTFDFEVEFRANARHEAGGNQIIRWELAHGDGRIVRGAAEPRGRWTLGEPVALTMQWAKDAPVFPLPPVPASAQPRMRIEGRTVSFRYGGRWSLIALLREYASSPADFAGFEDPRPQTLRFAVDTGTEPAGDEEKKKEEKIAPAPQKTGQVRVFVRVTLLTPDKKEELELPDFPSRAPIQGGEVADGGEPAERGTSR